MTARTIGLVGLGNMGRPIAENLVRAGFELTCFDAAGTSSRVPDGAAAADSVAAVAAASDTMLLSVPDGAASRTIADEIAAAPDRRVTVVVDLSTVGPDAATDVAARLKKIGVAYCDGPVSGGVAGAHAGTVAFMFSGPADVLESHSELFQSFAGSVFHVGTAPGQGQVMKLVNNALSAVALAASSEALAVGREYGLELSTMLDVINASSGRNTATSDKFPNRVLTGTYDAGFLTRLMAKDVRLFSEVAAAAGVSDHVLAAVADVWAECDVALPGSDFTAIWKHVVSHN